MKKRKIRGGGDDGQSGMCKENKERMRRDGNATEEELVCY